MAAQHVFSRAIQKMGLAANTPVAVAVSGGSDSLALTLLARQTFQKVIGITVDHRLHKESTSEAERAGDLVKSLGLEHHIVTLDWKEGRGGGLPRRWKVVTEKRYRSMLRYCRRKDIRTLMIAHHLDDQIETFLLRMAKGSGVDGLGGMYPSTMWVEFPQVNVLRPLLEVRKAALQEVCRNEGVEWIEDSSNQLDIVRNNVHKILHENEELDPGIIGLIKTCQEVRRNLEHQASRSLRKINLSVNRRYGCLSFSLHRLLSLPPTVLKKVFQSLALHVGGARRLITHKTFASIHKELLSGDKTIKTFGNCILFSSDLKKDTLIMGRALPKVSRQKIWTPIPVGNSIYWDGRWRISLKLLKKSDVKHNEKASDGVAKNREQLYVRHMKEEDYTSLEKRNSQSVGVTTLPDIKIWSGLPVVCTESGYVVLAPHLNVIDYSYGVYCDIAFDPLLPLLQDSDTHVH